MAHKEDHIQISSSMKQKMLNIITLELKANDRFHFSESYEIKDLLYGLAFSQMLDFLLLFQYNFLVMYHRKDRTKAA